MSVKVVTFFATLHAYAHALGQARLSGDAEEIAYWERIHDEYAQRCLEADDVL